MSFLRPSLRPVPLLLRQPLPQHRAIAASAAAMAKQEWMMYLPDKPGALQERMKVRPNHLENVKPHIDRGFIVFGGASLDEPAREGQPLHINGSYMMAVAETEAEVWDWIKQDVYYTSGVWDPEKGVSLQERGQSGAVKHTTDKGKH